MTDLNQDREKPFATLGYTIVLLHRRWLSGLRRMRFSGNEMIAEGVMCCRNLECS